MEAAMASSKRNSSGQYDDELKKAKRNGSTVDLTLAADFPTPDGFVFSGDDTIAAQVLWVDRYAVKFKIERSGREVWISKAFIAAVWPR